MKKGNIKNLWFTLVELIVTLIIIAILATIAFISLWEYPVKARDSVRKTDLKNIEKVLKIYQVRKWKLPTPDNIKATSSMTWWTEWEFGTWVQLAVQSMSELPKDPVTWKHYTYLVKDDGTLFKVVANLESWLDHELWTFASTSWVWAGWFACSSPQENYNWTCMTPTANSCFNFSAWTITAYNNTNPWCTTDVVIPKSMWGEAVTRIWDNAFSNKGLTSVVIPNSVTTIWNNAFRENNLTSLIISNSISSIWSYVFAYNNLESVTIPNSVTSIWYRSFFNNDLINLTIPNSVTSIWNSAFANSNLESLVIPNSVISIWSGAFYGNNLISIEIPSSITIIGNGVFRNNNLTSVTIPNSVTNIWYYAFRENSLVTVNIPNISTKCNNFFWNPTSNFSTCFDSSVTITHNP